MDDDWLEEDDSPPAKLTNWSEDCLFLDIVLLEEEETDDEIDEDNVESLDNVFLVAVILLFDPLLNKSSKVLDSLKLVVFWSDFCCTQLSWRAKFSACGRGLLAKAQGAKADPLCMIARWNKPVFNKEWL